MRSIYRMDKGMKRIYVIASSVAEAVSKWKKHCDGEPSAINRIGDEIENKGIFS